MKAIITKYHGPTDTMHSRYSADDGDGNRVIIGSLSALNSDENHRRAAITLIEKMGWNKDGREWVGGWIKTGMAWVQPDDRYRIAY